MQCYYRQPSETQTGIVTLRGGERCHYTNDLTNYHFAAVSDQNVFLLSSSFTERIFPLSVSTNSIFLGFKHKILKKSTKLFRRELKIP